MVLVVLALYPPDFIAQLMEFLGALAGAFWHPYVWLILKGTTKGAVWASFISGVGIHIKFGIWLLIP